LAHASLVDRRAPFYAFLTEQHDLRLVFLAGLICIATCGFVAWMLVSKDGCRPAGLNSESSSAFAENKSSILRSTSNHFGFFA
jgi:hypothetical protein